MSLSQETLLELMSLADGELEGEARLRVEKLVAESDEARRVLDGLRSQHVGMWLSESMDQRATAAGADRIADAVLSRLSAERPAGGVVARIDAARRSRPGASGRSAKVVVGAAFAATALAAGVALLLRSGDRGLLTAPDRMPVASVGMPSVDTQGPPAQAAPGSGVEVDEVDSPSRGISVFEIPLGRAGASALAGGGSASSVVIWIDDEGAK